MAGQQATDRHNELWRRHLAEHDVQARAELIETHTALAKKIAASMYARRYRDHIEFDEFFQFGLVGLIESVDRYDPDKGASFETFASYRIRGSIINGLGKMTEMRSQSAYRQRLRKDRMTSLSASDDKAGADLFDEMVELTLGLAIGFLLEDTGLAASSSENTGDQAYKSNHLAQLRELLIRAIDDLPERESQIVRYHYLQGAQFEVIADLLGVTRGRVSQLHKRALQRLRDRLGQDQSLDTFL